MPRTFLPKAVTLVVTPLVVLAACVKVWSPVTRAPGAVTAAQTAAATMVASSDAVPPKITPTLKVHLNNRELWILTRWKEDTATRALTGTGDRYSVDRKSLGSGDVVLPFDSIALVEAYRAHEKASFGLGLLSVWTVGAGIATGHCLADPKSCFGSCPTFYIDGDTGTVHAEGFSGSPLRVLEANDVDHLFRLDPPPGPFVITMKNEALETHAVRQVRLLLVDRPVGGRVLQASDGTLRPVTHFTAAARCTSDDGDCREKVRVLDESEWSSKTDSTDLLSREQILLAFAASDLGAERSRATDVGLVVAGRNTLVSTFVFYQALAFAGSRAGEMIASLERGTRAQLPPVFARLQEMATIGVQVAFDDGAWESVDAFHEAGPIATDIRVMPFTVPPDIDSVRVRLDLTRGFWRINHVALGLVGAPVTPLVLAPQRVEHVLTSEINPGSGMELNPLAVLNDAEHHLITYPGDVYALHFTVPVRTSPAGRELFLESTGYYYEWMRQEWLADEDAGRAAQLLVAPDAALKKLAPQFKAREATMDAIFWNSRVGRIRP